MKPYSSLLCFGLKPWSCSRWRECAGNAPCFSVSGFPKNLRCAFTLLEMLVVMVILAVLAAVSGPAISTLAGAGTVNRAVSDLEQMLELARLYAITQQTYVRVVIEETGTMVLPMCSADGTLQDSSAMGDASVWPALSRPLIFRDFAVTDGLNATKPDTSGDPTPSSTDIPAFIRSVPGFPSARFNAMVQFSPSGEASISSNAPVRFVKLGIDRREGGLGRNAAIVRISGTTGAIRVLRVEDGVQ